MKTVAAVLPDVLIFVGLALFGVGLWLIWPPIALVVIGLALLVTGLVAELGLLSQRPDGRR